VLKVVVHLIAPVPLATNNLDGKSRLVVVRVHGVDEGKRGDGNQDDNDSGNNSPDNLNGSVVSKLFRESLLSVVELGGDVVEEIEDQDDSVEEEEENIVMEIESSLSLGGGAILETQLPSDRGLSGGSASGQTKSSDNSGSGLNELLDGGSLSLGLGLSLGGNSPGARRSGGSEGSRESLARGKRETRADNVLLLGSHGRGLLERELSTNLRGGGGGLDGLRDSGNVLATHLGGIPHVLAALQRIARRDTLGEHFCYFSKIIRIL